MNQSGSQQLLELLVDLPIQTKDRIILFYELLVAENQKQNLTRLISPEDFKNGHLVDVLELLKTGWMNESVVDLGSGCGVPGLLAALIEPREWVLVESEKRKADFLARAVQELGLDHLVKVKAERLESYLKTQATDMIVARAVGSVEKIYSWIFKCSTWNKLVLLKGPGWEVEWQEFQKGRFKGALSLVDVHSYTTSSGARERKIIKLVRNSSHLNSKNLNVPRGTKN
jgi:16S rRNA (guanine527-N7)-methyltransferase